MNWAGWSQWSEAQRETESASTHIHGGKKEAQKGKEGVGRYPRGQREGSEVSALLGPRRSPSAACAILTVLSQHGRQGNVDAEILSDISKVMQRISDPKDTITS